MRIIEIKFIATIETSYFNDVTDEGIDVKRCRHLSLKDDTDEE